MMILNTIDANDMLIEAHLDDRVFQVGLSWNSTGEMWTLSIRDLNFSVMASGIAVVHNWPLLHQIRQPEFPTGELIVVAVPNKKIGRKSFLNGEATLYYVTLEDMRNVSV